MGRAKTFLTIKGGKRYKKKGETLYTIKGTNEYGRYGKPEYLEQTGKIGISRARLAVGDK